MRLGFEVRTQEFKSKVTSPERGPSWGRNTCLGALHISVQREVGHVLGSLGLGIHVQFVLWFSFPGFALSPEHRIPDGDMDITAYERA